MSDAVLVSEPVDVFEGVGVLNAVIDPVFEGVSDGIWGEVGVSVGV